ncbi:MAG: putative N-acetylmannosamine-6-phosphate 2-epimerase [Bryobacterales bacterium]|nr:putative N-acetylmannosamine-6-phosphate 2-epimerase [Bryobacterales bacterium]
MSENCPEIFRPLRGRLIVSCQAWEDDPFHGAEHMARFARAAVEGGAAAIRANGPDDIRAIRAAVSVPVIGLQKRVISDGRILITPELEDACALVEAGAHAVAVDCTARGQKHGALERVRRIREELRVPVTADIATVEEAIASEGAGASFVLSTMRGYTAETESVCSFDAAFIAELVRAVNVPVIAEGRIWTVEDAVAAMKAGAFAVVIGSAITRPKDITARFSGALSRIADDERRMVAGIDLGGTRIKAGLVSCSGEISETGARATCVSRGRDGLLDQMAEIGSELVAEARTKGYLVEALGIATAGWVDAERGVVVHATPNLPGWQGAEVAPVLTRRLGVPVFVENDVNALAVGEARFGAARSASTFVCVTLGTGVGGGCYIDGALRRGAHFVGNAIGHLVVQPGGLPCNCGQAGCLEQYASAAALLRYAGDSDRGSAEEIIAAAHRGDDRARAAIGKLADYLAAGCAQVIRLLDPELIVIGGGLAQDNPLLFTELEVHLRREVLAWERRGLRVLPSMLGYYAGVAGAGAVALAGLDSLPG